MKNVIKVITIISVLVIAGCDVSPLDKRRQDFVCRISGGTYRYTNFGPNVTCRNGAVKQWVSIIVDNNFEPNFDKKG